MLNAVNKTKRNGQPPKCPLSQKSTQKQNDEKALVDIFGKLNFSPIIQCNKSITKVFTVNTNMQSYLANKKKGPLNESYS